MVGVSIALAAVAVATSLLWTGGAPAARSSNLSKAMAFVEHQCPGRQRSVSTQMWTAYSKFNALYGNCLDPGGVSQHIWFFDGGRFVGRDARLSSGHIIGLWRANNALAFMYVLYRRADADCCATGGGAIVRFLWTGKRVKRLDPLPPVAHTKGVAVGR